MSHIISTGAWAGVVISVEFDDLRRNAPTYGPWWGDGREEGGRFGENSGCFLFAGR